MKTLGHVSRSTATGLFFWNMLPDNDAICAAAREVVYRDEAEAAIKTVSDELALTLRQLETAIKERDNAMRQVEGWMESAASFGKGRDFYRSLITQMGEAIGQRAYTSDDGSVQSEPLALRVAEIVQANYAPKNRFLRALRIIFTGK